MTELRRLFEDAAWQLRTAQIVDAHPELYPPGIRRVAWETYGATERKIMGILGRRS